jgi:hypothetical protein
MFEKAALIQNPAKCEVGAILWFLNAKGERPVGNSHIVALYGDVMNGKCDKVVP